MGAPEHARQVIGPRVRKGVQHAGFNFALMCVMCDALQWPDTKLVYNMAFDFPVTGNLEDSGVYKPIHLTYAAGEMQGVLDDLKSSNLEWIQKIDNEMRASALKCKLAAAEGGVQARLAAQIAVTKATKKVVKDRFTSPSVTMQDLIDRFTVDGEFVCRVLPRCGIWQGTKWDETSQQEIPKLRCIDNGLSSGTNKATDTLETITTPSFLFPADVIHAMCVHCDKQGVHLPATTIGLDDLFAAYRRIPNLQPQFTTVAIRLRP
jgi:hypothetical protein